MYLDMLLVLPDIKGETWTVAEVVLGTRIVTRAAAGH